MNQVFSRPVGRASDDDRKWTYSFAPPAAYLFATATAGGLTGLALGAAGAAVRDVEPGMRVPLEAAAAALIVLAVVLELQGRISPLPQRSAQVPRRWLLWRRRWATAIAFGLIIASGVLTYLEHAVAYALAGILVLAPSPMAAGLLGIAYGVTRGGALMWTWAANRFGLPRVDWLKAARHDRPFARLLAAATAVSSTGVAVVVI